MTALGKVVVGFVTCLILFIGYSAQYLMLIYFEGWNRDSIVFILLYNIFVLCILYNYYLSCTVDPGRVPEDWKPDLEGPVLEVKKSNMKPRYCKTCQCYKPPRAHHCSVCERCVLKMDHHCPWLNNCVGFYNYGHFIRFIFYVVVACGMCIFILAKRILQLFDDTYVYRNRDSITNFELTLLLLNVVGAVPVMLCVSMLSIFQFYGMGEGTTSIEGWEKDKVASLVKLGKVSEVRFPYDIGIFSNLCSVLGNNVLFWCVPQAMKGDGLSFPVTKYEDEGTLMWPPPEYSRDSDKNKICSSELDSDEELVVRPHDYSTGPLGRNVNRSPYTSFIDSDEDSGEEHSRFVVGSDEDSDEEPHPVPSRLNNSEYKRIATQRVSAGRTSQTDSPYDSDDAPIGALFQNTPTLPEYLRSGPHSE